MIDLKEKTWIVRLLISKIANAFTGITKKRQEKSVLSMHDTREERMYPRPQFKRNSWISLNGMWDFCSSENMTFKEPDEKKVKIPYPVQSLLSNAGDVNSSNRMRYRRVFVFPEGFLSDRVILHFGAVDQVCRVFVNRREVGRHTGGYLPFSFDITSVVREHGSNEITVYVKDELDSVYPYGKQSKTPGGMWYTPVSGIWQSVWLESVPEKYVRKTVCRYIEKPEQNTVKESHNTGIPDQSIVKESHNTEKDCCGDKGALEYNLEDDAFVEMEIDGTSDTYDVTVYEASLYNDEPHDNKKKELLKLTLQNGKNTFVVHGKKLWSPKTPYLYKYEIRTDKDTVESYFALRTVSIESILGKKRICLNHKPFFFHGVLDQGYYPDGIYTPKSDRLFSCDIKNMKELGFNTLRKHVKIESARFYYDCDRLGMIVFQDMVNNGKYSYFKDTVFPTLFIQKIKDKSGRSNAKTKQFFIKHAIDTVSYLEQFCSVVYYTIFNEGWGQFDGERVMKKLKEKDESRIYDVASGWFKQEESDVDSDHFYFHKIKPGNWTRPVIISECGGFGYAVSGHLLSPSKQYKYGTCLSKEELTEKIMRMYDEEVIPNIENGICGVIYTQLSDVEEEINGLYTYDRAVCKVIKEKIRDISARIQSTYPYDCMNI